MCIRDRSKAAESDRDYLAAFKAHKAELGAGERKGAPLCMQALCVVSPEWIKAAGDLHDPDNPRTRFCTFTQTGLAGLVAAFSVEGGTAQLGDAGDLVDADGGLEHQRYDLRFVRYEIG